MRLLLAALGFGYALLVRRNLAHVRAERDAARQLVRQVTL